ncbi:hypothetical protein OROMI_016200 [Orobanche minor]
MVMTTISSSSSSARCNITTNTTTMMMRRITVLVHHVSAKVAIYTGESLSNGDQLINGAFTLAMQVDCNLVLRGGSRVVCSTGTAGKGSIAMQQCRVMEIWLYMGKVLFGQAIQ